MYQAISDIRQCYLDINYVTVLKQLIQLFEAILPHTDDQICDLKILTEVALERKFANVFTEI